MITAEIVAAQALQILSDGFRPVMQELPPMAEQSRFWALLPLGVRLDQIGPYISNFWHAKRLGIPHVREDVQ